MLVYIRTYIFIHINDIRPPRNSEVEEERTCFGVSSYASV
jgi:hypothetical protein